MVDESGNPIPGVLVDAWTWYKGNEMTTGADGRFHLKGINGTTNQQLGEIVELRFSKAGMSPVYIRSQPLGVGDLAITMNAKTYIEGTVSGPDGRPLPNVPIRADAGPKHVSEEGFTITSIVNETKSDAEGKYRLYVWPDNYKVRVRVPATGIAQVQVTASANEAVSQDIKLEEGIRFVVKCVDGDTQAPVAGVKIGGGREKGMGATSDNDGLAVFEHMPADKFEFNISHKDYPKWWWPESPREKQRERDGNHEGSWHGIEVELTPGIQPVTLLFEKAIPVSGRVVDPAGSPVAGAIVVTALTGYGDAIDQTQRFTARTKKDGTFALTLPSSGQFQFNLIAHDGDYNKWRTWANGVSEPMSLKPGEAVNDLTLTLTAGATIKGKVVDPQGNPKAGKHVRAMSADGRDSRYVAPSAKTDAEGNFTLTHVRPGEVRVEVEPFWSNPPGDSSPTPIEHTAVTVTAGGTTEDVTVTTARRDDGGGAPAGGGNSGL